MTLYYTVPATDRPSWGMGIIYHHVNMLRNGNFEAFIVKEKDLYVPKWLNLKVPIIDFQQLKKTIKPLDILIVAEAMVDIPGLKEIDCRKFLFVQNVAYMFEKMPNQEDHISLGFEHVIIIMPHMKSVIKNHVKLPYTLIPPFVADYFFKTDFSQRRRQILIYPKFHQIDYSIVNHLLTRYCRQINKSWIENLVTRNNWTIKELKSLTHKQVAEEMKSATFFISLNNFEALNTSVMEAMAAGAVVFTYEGFGPKDFLKNSDNAIVFSNNEAYKLVETLCEWIDNFDYNKTSYEHVQRNAFNTALSYKYDACKTSLLDFFSNIKGD